MLKKTTQYGLLLLSILPSVSFAIKYKSLYQEDYVPFYMALGGGWGLQRADHFHLHKEIPGFVTEVNQPDDEVAHIGIGYASLGYIFPNNPLRLEVAYNYFGKGDYDWNELIHEPVTPGLQVEASGGVFSHTVMVNGFLDIIYDQNWVPFVMAGVGYGLNVAKFSYESHNSITGTHFSKNSDTEFTSNFVWNAGAGLTYNINDEFSVSGQVAYVGLGKANFDAVPPAENDGNNVDFLKVNDLGVVNFTAYFAYHF